MTKRVLITGVSSGIGLAQARLFLEKGYQVYGVDQGEKPLLQRGQNRRWRQALTLTIKSRSIIRCIDSIFRICLLFYQISKTITFLIR
ncbi:SDR family NAD(P)-dependent oxidoreductase, partial [Stenotrophomonas acidaminiphila]|nr:SDR family NAD(P)-dependent oxidoreductase [Stenotrophomonas acidaminiphila]